MDSPKPRNLQNPNVPYTMPLYSHRSSLPQPSSSSSSQPLLQFVPPASSQPPPSSSASQPLNHKNRLQQYAQRSNMQLPIYHTVNEGAMHAPKFRSTVCVGGKYYTSQNVFHVLKAAEQDVAKVAYEKIVSEIKDEELPHMFEKAMFFKSILNEFATKMNLEKVTYSTVKLEGHLFFRSSLVFNGKSYDGDPARTKKEAEQLAARKAIYSNLNDSTLGTRLSEVIKSKSKYCAISFVTDVQHVNTASPIASSGHVVVSAAPGTVESNENSSKFEVALPEPSSRGLQQTFPLSQQECPEDSKPSDLSQQAGEQHCLDDSSSLKMRKKNKKKANKKARMDPLPSTTALPLSQAPPSVVSPVPLGQPSCTVAQ